MGNRETEKKKSHTRSPARMHTHRVSHAHNIHLHSHTNILIHSHAMPTILLLSKATSPKRSMLLRQQVVSVKNTSMHKKHYLIHMYANGFDWGCVHMHEQVENT